MAAEKVAENHEKEWDFIYVWQRICTSIPMW